MDKDNDKIIVANEFDRDLEWDILNKIIGPLLKNRILFSDYYIFFKTM